MFIPNNTGILTPRAGRDLYGQTATFGEPVSVRCSVVHLINEIGKTPVRTDSSASRGNAEDAQPTAKILFHRRREPNFEDKFEIEGLALEVMKVEKRFDVLGQLDHFEVDLRAWPG